MGSCYKDGGRSFVKAPNGGRDGKRWRWDTTVDNPVFIEGTDPLWESENVGTVRWIIWGPDSHFFLNAKTEPEDPKCLQLRWCIFIHRGRAPRPDPASTPSPNLFHL